MQEKSLAYFNKNNLIHICFILLYLCFIFLITPIFLAFILSSIISPTLVKIEKKVGIKYTFLIIIFSLLLISLIVLCLYLFFIYGEQVLTLFYFTIKDWLAVLEEVPYLSQITLPISEFFSSFFENLISSLQLFIHYIFEILLFIIAFYISLIECRRHQYWYFIYVPNSYRKKWQNFLQDALNIFLRYFTIEIRLMLITTILLCIGFSVLGFTNPILKGLLLAILDCIPFFGISLVLIPVAIYFAATNHLFISLSLILLLIITIIVRQIFDAYFWASTVKIKTIHTFFISAVSFSIFGVYGIVVSPIMLLAVMKWRLAYERLS